MPGALTRGRAALAAEPCSRRRGEGPRSAKRVRRGRLRQHREPDFHHALWRELLQVATQSPRGAQSTAPNAGSRGGVTRPSLSTAERIQPGLCSGSRKLPTGCRQLCSSSSCVLGAARCVQSRAEMRPPACRELQMLVQMLSNAPAAVALSVVWRHTVGYKYATST